MDKPYHHGDLRAALLEAAEALLDRAGIEALTLRAAAREAGVSHAAPRHHFGDLTGLLSALATAGFIRLRAHLLIQFEAAGATPGERLTGVARGYVAFARECPGLFQLMFRSERLDWSHPALSEAGDAAFALLTPDASEPKRPGEPPGHRNLVVALARWSLVHGLATLLLDGRFQAVSAKRPGTDFETLIEAVLTRSVNQDNEVTAAAAADFS